MAVAMANTLNQSPLDDTTALAINNVFENDLILGLILEALDKTNDLITARLISSKWRRLATEIVKERNWTTRNFIVFYNEQRIQSYLDTFSKSKENVMFSCFRVDPEDGLTHCFAFRLNKFFQVFQNSVKSLNLIMPLDSPVQFESILQSQANSLTELKIVTDGEQVYEFEMDFANVDFNLTSLNYFCTDSVSGIAKRNSKHKLNILESVLSRIPSENKNTFKLCIGESQQIRATIALLQKYDMVKSLKLQHITYISKGEFNLLKNSGVELEYLVTEDRVTYRDATGDEGVEEALWVQDMYDYLCYQRNTLKMLEWESKTFKFPPWGMPAMTKLKLKCQTLERVERVENAESDSEDEDEDEDRDEDEGQPPPVPGQIQIQNPIIIYSDSFPNLQDLRLELDSVSRFGEVIQNALDFQSMFIAPQLPFTTLQKLKVDLDVNAELLTRISRIFPRIKSLDISHHEILSDENQWDFYSALWNAEFKSTLEKLVIRFYGRRRWGQFELFSFLAGIREEDIEEDQNLISALGDSSVRNYTNLKKVELLSSTFGHAVYAELRERALLSIFGKIEKLEYLYIDRAICEFSDHGKEFLQKLKSSSTSRMSSPQLDNPIKKEFQTEFDCRLSWN